MMSDAVAAVLARPLERLAPKLRTEYESVTLELGAAPTRDELKSLAENGAGAYIKRWAARLLREKDAGQPLARNYPYPVEIWRLGGSSCGSRWEARSWLTMTCGLKIAMEPTRG